MGASKILLGEFNRAPCNPYGLQAEKGLRQELTLDITLKANMNRGKRKKKMDGVGHDTLQKYILLSAQTCFIF